MISSDVRIAPTSVGDEKQSVFEVQIRQFRRRWRTVPVQGDRHDVRNASLGFLSRQGATPLLLYPFGSGRIGRPEKEEHIGLVVDVVEDFLLVVLARPKRDFVKEETEVRLLDADAPDNRENPFEILVRIGNEILRIATGRRFCRTAGWGIGINHIDYETNSPDGASIHGNQNPRRMRPFPDVIRNRWNELQCKWHPVPCPFLDAVDVIEPQIPGVKLKRHLGTIFHPADGKGSTFNRMVFGIQGFGFLDGIRQPFVNIHDNLHQDVVSSRNVRRCYHADAEIRARLRRPRP